jgi:hypothetical protein
MVLSLQPAGTDNNSFIRGCRDGDKVGDRIPERTSRACMDPRSPSIIHAQTAICVRDQLVIGMPESGAVAAVDSIIAMGDRVGS